MRLSTSCAYFGIVLALTVTGGCDSTGDGAKYVIQDSAGIEIVTNRRPAAVDVWTIDSTPITRLGGDGAELHLVRAAVRLSSGSLVVASGHEIALYDRDGREVKRTGRFGDGPGDFRRISALWADPSDNVYAWDMLRSRSTLKPDLEVVETQRLNERALRSIAPYIATIRPISGDVILLSASRLSASEPAVGSLFRPPYLHALVNLRGTEADTLLEHDGGYVQTYLGGERTAMSYFSPHFQAAVSPAGHVYLTDGTDFDLLEFDETGSLVRRIRRSGPIRAPTKEEVRNAVGSRRELLKRDRSTQEVEQQLKAALMPKYYPAMSGVAVDKLGYVWITSPVGPMDSVTTWSVFTSTGRWHTLVTLSGVVTALEIGSDYIVTMSRDEYDRQFVSVHRLTRHRSSLEPDA